MKRIGYTDTSRCEWPRRLLRRWAAVTTVLTMGCLWVGPVAAATHVLFSFGKVEVLQSDTQEWQFVRAGMELEDSDVVRMPPVSLLRLGRDDGDLIGLLSGACQMSVSQLILAPSATHNGAEPTGTGEAELADVLPAGDASRLTEAFEHRLRLSPEAQLLWNSGNVDVGQRIRTAIDSQPAEPSADPPHGRSQLETLERLHDVVREAHDELQTLADQHDAGNMAPALLLAAVIDIAGLETERLILADGSPVLLVKIDVPLAKSGILTANRDLLYVSGDGSVHVPLQPVSADERFIEAWYRGAEALASTSSEGVGRVP